MTKEKQQVICKLITEYDISKRFISENTGMNYFTFCNKFNNKLPQYHFTEVELHAIKKVLFKCATDIANKLLIAFNEYQVD